MKVLDQAFRPKRGRDGSQGKDYIFGSRRLFLTTSSVGKKGLPRIGRTFEGENKEFTSGKAIIVLWLGGDGRCGGEIFHRTQRKKPLKTMP